MSEEGLHGTHGTMSNVADNANFSAILVHLGKMEGLLQSVLTRIESNEREHQRDTEHMQTRLNNHSDRLKELETHNATRAGEAMGKRLAWGLIITCLLLAGGFLSWLLANGLSILQAGAGM